jgi:hypothetical protein
MKSLFPILIVLVATACGDSNGLPDATLTNIEREDTLYALVGTPVATASGYTIEGARRVRTDLSAEFDFVFDLEPDGRHVFIPRAALGIDTSAALNPGLQARPESFDAITTAPSNGYTTTQVIPIAEGDRFVMRGRITCLSLGLPKYGKLEVLGFDDLAKTVNFRVLIDDSCGFKSLEPGVPNR